MRGVSAIVYSYDKNFVVNHSSMLTGIGIFLVRIVDEQHQIGTGPLFRSAATSTSLPGLVREWTLRIADRNHQIVIKISR